MLHFLVKSQINVDISKRKPETSSSPPEKYDRIALWYTGVTRREHHMYTHILGILSALYRA